MRKIQIFSLLFLFVFILSSASFSAQKTQLAFGMGAGVYAGGYSAQGDLLYRMPKMFGLDDVYLRSGVAYVDTKNLSPAQNWRKFAPLYIDGMKYLADNIYVGAGLNYPLKVSDGETGNVSGQIYLGADLAAGPGKFYGEAGYSILRIKDNPSFKGLHAMLGYRYDYWTFFVPDKVKRVKPRPEPVIREVVEIKEEVEIIRPMPRRARPNIIIYKIVWGDTLADISEKYLGDAKLYPDLAKLNNIEDPDLIYEGNTLKIDLNLKK